MRESEGGEEIPYAGEVAGDEGEREEGGGEGGGGGVVGG